MRVGNARHSLAAAVVCLLTAVGCNCGQVRLREVTKPALVEGVGGVSCNGEAVRLTSLVTGGRPPFTYHWEPADGLSDPSAESPMATVSESRTYALTVTDSKGQVSNAVARVERRRPPTIDLKFASCRLKDGFGYPGRDDRICAILDDQGEFVTAQPVDLRTICRD